MSTLGDVAGGAATGGLYNVAQAAGLFDPHTTSQSALMDPSQTAARQALAGFINTGTMGNFTAGAAVPLGYGDYTATGQEQTGLSTLSNLLQNGIPQQYQLGDQALSSLLNPDPSAVQAQFAPFAAQVQRQVGQSEADLNRAAGAQGSLYSTKTIQGLGDIEARGNNTLTGALASLTNDALNRRLSAVPLAYQAGNAEQNAALQQVQASQQYGDLTRSLNDQLTKARDAELLRRRSELAMPIQAAENLSGSNVQFGVPSVTTSPFQQLLGMAGQAAGQFAGSYAGQSGAMAAMA